MTLQKVHLCSNGNLHDSLRMYRAWIWWWYGPIWGRGYGILSIVGDITPSNGVPKQERSRLEQAALNEMCEVLGGGQTLKRSKELWAEYENNASLEANLVKDFSKFEFLNDAIKKQVEMILQALEYEMEHGKVLDEFFLSTAGKYLGS